MQEITPCLWFNDKAEQAAKFYVSVFKNSKIKGIARYGAAGAKASGKPKGTVMTVLFQIEGQEFLALNGGPQFTFSPAISLIVNCKTQKEVDALWNKLSADGTGKCGWLKDKYGLSWQVVPTFVREVMQNKDAKKADRVMKAIVQMEKLDLKKLRQAFK
jgi:predicted 3-demethylubiquinone-9 3-methyltransferase (glyoxalase superfamily)